MSIENKRASRPWCSFRTTKSQGKSLSTVSDCINEAELRQKNAKGAAIVFAVQVHFLVILDWLATWVARVEWS
jgi:hypothetical protein